MVRPKSQFVSVSRRGSAGGDPERTVLWVRGDHDIATKASLAVSITRAAQLDDAPLLVDLSAVTFMDASTLGAIVGSWNRLRSRGQSLEVRAPSRPALRVLELCELAHLVHCERVQSTAVASALGTWVDVPPMEPRDRINHAAARVTAPPGTRQPAEVEEGVATVGLDRGGP